MTPNLPDPWGTPNLQGTCHARPACSAHNPVPCNAAAASCPHAISHAARSRNHAAAVSNSDGFGGVDFEHEIMVRWCKRR